MSLTIIDSTGNNSPERQAAEQADAKRHRNLDIIEKSTKRANRAEKEQGHESPDVIYEGFQRDDVITEDTRFDNSRAALAGRTSLPIKQYRIRPDGTLVKEMGAAALDAVKQGKFCFRCEEEQPGDSFEKAQAWKRSEQYGLMPMGARPSENCVYCGARLGIAADEPPVGAYTPEQQAMQNLILPNQ